MADTGRCETCAFWIAAKQPDAHAGYVGECTNYLNLSKTGVPWSWIHVDDSAEDAEITTGQNFGCVRHEPRQGATHDHA